MIRRAWLFTLFLIVLAACGAGDPAISAKPDAIDFGEVTNGDVLTAEVVVSNSGSVDLVIEAVSTSCGCTTAQIDPTVIAPGAAGTLIVTYDSGAHGPDEVGPIERQVFIASNDPLRSEILVKISATVLPRP